MAHIALGQALTTQGVAEARRELRTAVALADELGSPLVRWQSRAALVAARSAAVKGTAAEERREHAREAAAIIDSIATGLCTRAWRRSPSPPRPWSTPSPRHASGSRP